MTLLRFIAGLLGLTLMVGGTVYAIFGFWGVSRGSPDASLMALAGIVAAIVGGAIALRAPRFEAPRPRPKDWSSSDEDAPTELRSAAHTVPAMLLSILGFVLFVGGALYGILGLWGMTRGGFDAWKFALVGTAAAVAGGALLLGTFRDVKEPEP